MISSRLPSRYARRGRLLSLPRPASRATYVDHGTLCSMKLHSAVRSMYMRSSLAWLARITQLAVDRLGRDAVDDNAPQVRLRRAHIRRERVEHAIDRGLARRE